MTRITPPEWEALSAYLDNELPSKERAQLETRLKTNVELRQGLEELRKTQVVLRNQPRLRAPRNFTLTPQMAGVRAGGRGLPSSFSILRLSSVLATVFFLIVVVGDWLASSIQPASVPVSQAPLQEAMPPGFGGGGGGEDNLTPEAKAVEPLMVPQETLAANMPLTDSSGTGLVLVTPTPEPATAMAYTEREPEAMQPFEQRPEENIPSQNLVQTKRTVGWGTLPLRILQILLAFLAVGTGVAAIFLRRSGIR